MSAPEIEQVAGSPLRQVPAPKLAAVLTEDGVMITPLADPEAVPDQRCYRLIRDGEPRSLDLFERDPEGFGAINAVNRAQWHSTRGGPVTVWLGARPLCRYVRGRRAELPARA